MIKQLIKQTLLVILPAIFIFALVFLLVVKNNNKNNSPNVNLSIKKDTDVSVKKTIEDNKSSIIETSNAPAKLLDQFDIELKVTADAVFKQSPLAGVTIDGAFDFDNENLIFNIELKRRLDSYLLLRPKASYQQIYYLIAKELALNSDNNEQAITRYQQIKTVLSDYLTLNQELASYPVAMADTHSLLESVENISRIRQSILGEELANAFFAKEEDYIKQQIEKAAVEQLKSK